MHISPRTSSCHSPANCGKSGSTSAAAKPCLAGSPEMLTSSRTGSGGRTVAGRLVQLGRPVGGCRPNGSCATSGSVRRTLFRCKWPIMCQRIGRSASAAARSQSCCGRLSPRSRAAGGDHGADLLRPDVLGDRHQPDSSAARPARAAAAAIRAANRPRSRRFVPARSGMEVFAAFTQASHRSPTTACEALATRMHDGCRRASRANSSGAANRDHVQVLDQPGSSRLSR